jgi:uncharacterized membrane protein
LRTLVAEALEAPDGGLPQSEGAPKFHRPLWQQPRFWLAAMVVGFFVISLYAGIVSYTDFQTQNNTDAGIITQAVASTAHGHVTPFYESYDCLVKSRCSFLLVHPSFVLYAAVPFYDLAPSTPVLFALQSAVVAAAAVPLYSLTRQVTNSSRKALLAAGLFLVWAPVFAADAFSLHLESVLPLELIALAALWQAGRYRLGLVVAAIAFLTFEIAPLFVFLLGVFFLFPYVERPARNAWRRWRAKTAEPSASGSIISRLINAVRAGLRIREVQSILVLMGASLAAYTALSMFVNVWGAEIIGVRSPPLPPGISGVFYNNSSPPTQGVWLILHSAQTLVSGEYWLILFALLGFIPLLSPRSLILSVPWIGWTFLTDSSRFTTLGNQYAMVAAAPLFIGLAYGLRRVPLGESHPGASVTEESAIRTSAPGAPPTVVARRRRRAVTTVWVVVLLVVIVANGLLIPINPVLLDLGVVPGDPFISTYFNHSLEIDPAFAWTEQLISTIPSDSTVMTTSAIFPLLANYPHAYVMVAAKQMNTGNLPFNVSDGPQFVLLPAYSLSHLSMNASRNLSDPAAYGIRSFIESNPLGPLLLYERGYAMPAELFGPELPRVPAAYSPGSGLSPGPKGTEASNASAPPGRVIQSNPGSNRTGLVWTGPNAFLQPGAYTAVVQLLMSGAGIATRPNETVLRITVEGFGGLPINETLRASSFVPGDWTNLTFNFTLTNPLPDVNVRGILQSEEASVAVATVLIRPEAT